MNMPSKKKKKYVLYKQEYIYIYNFIVIYPCSHINFCQHVNNILVKLELNSSKRKYSIIIMEYYTIKFQTSYVYYHLFQ